MIKTCRACGKEIPPYPVSARARKFCIDCRPSKWNRETHSRMQVAPKNRMCLACGVEITARPGSGKQRTFCVDCGAERLKRLGAEHYARDCRRGVKRRTQVKACVVCGKEFHPWNREAQSCSRSCAVRVSHYKPKTCRGCGTTFHPGNAGVKFCSATCHNKYSSSRYQSKECPECGNKFHPRFATQRFCGRTCGGRASVKIQGHLPAWLYYLLEPDTREIRYVGLTVTSPDVRLLGHLHTSRNDPRDKSPRVQWIKSLSDRGAKPIIKGCAVVPRSDVSVFERRLIAAHTRAGTRLLNVSRGGESGMKRVKRVLDRVCALPGCGKMFHPHGGEHKASPGKYCSNECRYASRRTSQESKTARSDARRVAAAEQHQHNLQQYPHTCVVCGKEFVARRSNHYVCSSECRRVRNRKQYAVIHPPKRLPFCLGCGVIMPPPTPGTDLRRRKYCSERCGRNAAKRLGRMRLRTTTRVAGKQL